MASVAVPKSVSRPSSRSSYRAPSPAGSVDSGMSTFSNAILGVMVIWLLLLVGRQTSRKRDERASTLEKLSRTSTPQQRNFSPLMSPSAIPIPISVSSPRDFTTPTSTPTRTKARRTSSFDKLAAFAAAGGTESLIPLPVRVTPARRTSSPNLNGNGHTNGGLDSNAGIPEGVPIEFGVASPSLGASRSLSPTRTLSRECGTFVFSFNFGLITLFFQGFLFLRLVMLGL